MNKQTYNNLKFYYEQNLEELTEYLDKMVENLEKITGDIKIERVGF